MAIAARLLACSALLVTLGCAQRTEIVVEVDSDLAVPGEIDAVEVIVTGSQSSSASGSLLDRPLPRTVGLVPAGGSLGPIEVRAVGTLRGVPVVERVATTSFLQGRTLLLRMFLSRACRGVTCGAGETCDEGRCVSSEVDPEMLPDWTDADAGSQRRDAGPDREDGGADAGVDAGPRDSGTDSGTDAGTDAGPDPDAGMDAGPDPDAGTDAGPDPDAGPPDSGAPDAGPRGCDDIYGGLDGYEGCAERASECEFFVELGGSSCEAFCTSVGGACLRTYRESSGNHCTRTSGPRDCEDPHGNEICVCTRVP